MTMMAGEGFSFLALACIQGMDARHLFLDRSHASTQTIEEESHPLARPLHGRTQEHHLRKARWVHI